MNYLRCPVCDQPVPEHQGAGRPRRYCSRACQSAAERGRDARRRLLGQLVEARANTNEKETG
jgi:predicted nucleic acid-binding Zn ribbon protein